MSQKKSPWSYDIKTNSITFDGRQTNLTTDDVVWSETVQANGIIPYGGITLQTRWEAGETLTDTMRQLIEKVVVQSPSIKFSPEIPQYYPADRNKPHEVTLSYVIDPGKYIDDQETGVSCSVSIYVGDNTTPIKENTNITTITRDSVVIEPKYSFSDGVMEYVNYEPIQLRVVFSHSDGVLPVLEGASTEYLENTRIKSSTCTYEYVIYPKEPVYIECFNSYDLGSRSKTMTIDYDNDITFQNKAGDDTISIKFNNTIAVVSLYYNINHDSKLYDGIDYSDLLHLDSNGWTNQPEHKTVRYSGLASESNDYLDELVETFFGPGESDYTIGPYPENRLTMSYSLTTKEPFDNINTFTLKVTRV